MSALQIAPGKTWFDTHRTTFQDVPINPVDKGISTTEFLDAAEATTTLFDTLTQILLSHFN